MIKYLTKYQKLSESFLEFGISLIQLLYSSNNLEDLQQKLISELAGLSCWFKANKLSLNLDKTSHMLFSGKGNRVPVANFSLHIDNTIIKRVDNCTFLGVYLDENLSWSVHIDKIFNKISKLSESFLESGISLIQLLYLCNTTQ